MSIIANMLPAGKISVYLIIILSIFLLWPSSSLAAEQIDNYEVYIKVNKDSELNIVEKIQYNFGTDQRHGIFREIPDSIQNKEGKKYKLDISITEIIHENNREVPYTQSQENEKVVLKIGDPDKTITGLNTYIISYRVKGAITYFDPPENAGDSSFSEGHDELYWNAIGTNWSVPILRSSVIVDLSDLENLTSENISVICYTGKQGSFSQNCGYTKNLPTVAVASNMQLSPYEGLTFALAVPSGSVEYFVPQTYRSAWLKSWAGIWFMITFAANVLLSAGVLVLWFLYGRDPKDDRVLVRMYDPPKDIYGKDMTPIEVGTVVDEYLHSHDISAEIIHLAISKWIVIREDEKNLLGGVIKEKNIILQQGPKLINDSDMSELKDHQKELIRALKLDKNEFVSPKNDTSIAAKILKIHEHVYKHLTDEGYFPENPNKVRTRYLIIGFAFIFITLFVPGVLFLLFSFFMSRKTLRGLEAKRHALGLKQFLESQDRQFEFQEKNYYLFEKLLPYAINFGVAKVWAEKFSDLYDYKPEWYSSNSMGTLNTYSLVNSLQSNLRSVESSYSSSSSSGFSGGSSGGGGGGGGGGSW